MKVRGMIKVHQTQETYRFDEIRSTVLMDEASSRILFYLYLLKVQTKATLKKYGW